MKEVTRKTVLTAISTMVAATALAMAVKEATKERFPEDDGCGRDWGDDDDDDWDDRPVRGGEGFDAPGNHAKTEDDLIGLVREAYDASFGVGADRMPEEIALDAADAAEEARDGDDETTKAERTWLRDYSGYVLHVGREDETAATLELIKRYVEIERARGYKTKGDGKR